VPKRTWVPPEEYNESYLLDDQNEGYQEFLEGRLSVVKTRELKLLDVRAGASVLDVGFGRGELLYHCAKRGAEVAGVDYSACAYGIAKNYLREFPEADLRIADCRQLPFPSNRFDRVMAGDVIEHLRPGDAITMLQEMYRVLKPGGRMVLHTAPNTVFTRFVYPAVKPLMTLLYAEVTRGIRKNMNTNTRVHVFEYNLFSLRRILRRAGLEQAEVWVEQDILRSGEHRYTQAMWRNPLFRFVGSLGRFRLVRFFLGNDLFASCTKLPRDNDLAAIMPGTAAPVGERPNGSGRRYPASPRPPAPGPGAVREDLSAGGARGAGREPAARAEPPGRGAPSGGAP